MVSTMIDPSPSTKHCTKHRTLELNVGTASLVVPQSLFLRAADRKPARTVLDSLLLPTKWAKTEACRRNVQSG